MRVTVAGLAPWIVAWVFLGSLLCRSVTATDQSRSDTQGGVPKDTADPRTMLPRGVRVGEIQFDATLELYLPTPRARMLLFARYWVSPDAVHVELLWVEPQWNPVPFPWLPAVMSISHTKDRFRAEHSLWGFKEDQPAPSEPRGLFEPKLGDYPIPEMRFAYQTAQRRRVTEADLASQYAVAGQSGVYAKAIEGPNKAPGQLRIALGANRLDLAVLQSGKEKPAKAIRYRTERREGRTVLLGQEVDLPERFIPVGPTSLQMDIDGKQATLTQLPARYHLGGRKCRVVYEEHLLGGTHVSLPKEITVSTGDGKVLLRRAKMLAVTRVPEGSTAAVVASRDHVKLAYPQWEIESRFRERAVTYWLKGPGELSPAHRNELKQWAAEFRKLAAAAPTTCDRLRYRQMSILAAIHLGDGDLLAKDIGPYLEAIHECASDDLLLHAARELIRLVKRWKQPDLEKQIETVVPREASRVLGKDVAGEFSSVPTQFP